MAVVVAPCPHSTTNGANPSVRPMVRSADSPTRARSSREKPASPSPASASTSIRPATDEPGRGRVAGVSVASKPSGRAPNRRPRPGRTWPAGRGRRRRRSPRPGPGAGGTLPTRWARPSSSATSATSTSGVTRAGACGTAIDRPQGPVANGGGEEPGEADGVVGADGFDLAAQALGADVDAAHDLRDRPLRCGNGLGRQPAEQPAPVGSLERVRAPPARRARRCSRRGSPLQAGRHEGS